MRSLVKKEILGVRLGKAERAELERAAKLASQKRGEIVWPSTLLREIGMQRVRELLAEADQAA